MKPAFPAVRELAPAVGSTAPELFERFFGARDDVHPTDPRALAAGTVAALLLANGERALPERREAASHAAELLPADANVWTRALTVGLALATLTEPR